MDTTRRIFKPPMIVGKEKRIDRNLLIFLAGTIDGGDSYDWQADATEMLTDYDIANPRRDDYNPKEEQSIDNPYFKGQVDWELDNLEYSDIILLNLLPNSKSPISLYELGAFQQSKKIIVVCTEEFYRNGNVEIICKRNDIPLFTTLIDAIVYIKNQYKKNV